MLLIDVDYFKDYNDANGHSAGDSALRFVAERSCGVMRNAGDLICRYGGDEFVVILPSTDEDGAMLIAQRILASIVEKRMPHSRSPHNIVTVSIGVASVQPSDGHDHSELFDAADMGLYTAKQLGRNCCASANTSKQYMVP
jgi:diguanylate cyclase (GGDEF)-like protein